jgi:fused signal recognition particle receptor
MGDAKKGWFERIAIGLSRTSSRIRDGISGIVTGRKLDDAAIEELEELLISSDLGVATAARLTAELARTRFGSEVTAEEIRNALADDIAKILAPIARPLQIDPAKKPYVVLVVGVNGVGKTTTIGKLARHYLDQGLSVMLAAGDTFRAAGVSQLKLWGDRIGVPVIARDTGADAAGLVFDALVAARDAATDLLIVDTAGRLHNRADLMAGLEKIIRVMKKVDAEAPHSCVLVLDATTGQNAHAQVEVFRDMTDVNGLIVTKLDGTAKGGVLVALADRFGLPVHAIGVGEGEDDLRPFEARAFARGLMVLTGDDASVPD